MRNGLMRFLFVLLALFILVAVTSQIYTAVKDEYKTETAVIFSSADKVSFRGIYIRDESVIRKSYSGVLSYPGEDGSKVANGSVIAYVYNSEEDIETNRRITALEAETELLRAAQNPGTVLTARPEFIASLISEKYQAVATDLAKKDISDIKSGRDELLTLMSIYQISVQQEDGYDDRIAQLEAQISELKAKQKVPRSVVESPDSGYFVSYTDGYESVLKINSTDSITAELIKDVIANEKSVREGRSKSEIGKLVKGYDWKIAGIIDNSNSVYNPGDAVSLSFASTPDTVSAVIESLEPTENPQEWVMILRCDEMTFDLVQKRVERVEMTLNDFEGIKVPRSALRFNKNNEKGCYVLWGQRVLFKKVDVIFETEDYILSAITSDESYICVYDDIIIEGVDTAAYMANSGSTEENNGLVEDTEDDVEIYSQTEPSETTAASETEASESEETAPESSVPEETTQSSEATEGEIQFE